MRPTDIGNEHTISGSFRRWRREGLWARVMETLPQWERQSHAGCPHRPRAVPIATVSRQPRQAQTWALTGPRKAKDANGLFWSTPLGCLWRSWSALPIRMSVKDWSLC